MIHSTSLLHHNHSFLFSFRSFKPSLLHSDSHSHTQLQLQLHSQPFSFSNSISLPSSSPSSSSLCCRVARVSTEALELSPPQPGFNFRREIARLSSLRDKLSGCVTLDDKRRVIDADSRVRRFFGSSSRRRNAGLARVLAALRLDSDDLFFLKCLVAAGQEHVLCLGEIGPPLESPAASSSSVKSAFYALANMIENLDSYNRNSGAGFGNNGTGMTLEDHEIRDLNKLLETLAQIERFYNCIGGIIGSVPSLSTFTIHYGREWNKISFPYINLLVNKINKVNSKEF